MLRALCRRRVLTLRHLAYRICMLMHFDSRNFGPSNIVRLNNSSAVINEAFRIHPPVGLILERHVPVGGDIISGVHLPEGTIVGINAWVLHRNKSIFGDDAEEFRPERWIESDAERLRKMRRNLFTVSECFTLIVFSNLFVLTIQFL